MCLTVSETTKQKTVKGRNKIAYKVLIDDGDYEYRTPYMNRYVSLDVLTVARDINNQPIEKFEVRKTREEYAVHRGIHGLLNLKSAKQELRWNKKYNGTGPFVIVKMIIPVGAKYMLGYFPTTYISSLKNKKNNSIVATEVIYKLMTKRKREKK